MFKDSGLQNKVALVTGGARGIGRAIVALLASEGVKVHFFYHASKNEADEFCLQCEQQQQAVHAWQVDVRDSQQCVETVDAIIEQDERIDILVNNSGIVRDDLLVGLEESDIKDVIDTNLMGVFNVSRAVTPHMTRQREGCIINLSSVAGEKGGRGQTNYAATKGAINAFTKSLAVELAKRNIRVNAVAPGVINTQMSQQVRDLAGEQVLSEILVKRYGEPDEIAYAVCFLASKYGAYINGAIIPVDGGFKM